MQRQIFGSILVVLSTIGSSLQAQQCSRPAQPEVAGEKLRILQKRAAYAAFLADECGFENEVQKRFGTLVKTAFSDSSEEQQRNIDEFRTRKKTFASDAGFLGVKKRCLLETGKTKAFVNDAADDISGYTESIGSMRRKYTEKLEEWNVCVARQKAAEEAARAQAIAAETAAKAVADAEAYKRSEEYARKKAAQDVEATFRGSLMESGTFVLRLRNGSSQTAEFQLRCYQNNGNYKNFPIALAPGGTTEIGFLEGWTGNFVSGEYCEANHKGEGLWKVTKK
jgi:hypothetical protein